MPTMKVTPDAAMRARDVSRPHAEHLEWAEEAEPGVTATTDVVIEADVVVAAAEMDIPDPEYPNSEERPTDAGRMDAGRVDGSRADAGRADAGRADGIRRRRVRNVRSSSRRGRPSR
jgi:hypothetical protein